MQLGIGLARKGNSVLLVDADSQASLTVCLGISRPDEIDITLATLMKAAIDEKHIPDGLGISDLTFGFAISKDGMNEIYLRHCRNDMKSQGK